MKTNITIGIDLGDKNHIAVVFDDYERAMEQIVGANMHKGSLLQDVPGTLNLTYATFYCAITSISMARAQPKKKKKNLQMAKFFASQIDSWVDQGNPNVPRYDELLKS